MLMRGDGLNPPKQAPPPLLRARSKGKGVPYEASKVVEGS